VSYRFHGFSNTSEMFEVAIPALLRVQPRAEGSEGCGLVDAWKSDIVCGDGRAGEGVTECRWKNGVRFANSVVFASFV
jgi:hypothetical protein